MSQEELGHLVGTSGQQVSRLEKEERRITVGWLRRIGSGLGVPPALLLDPRDQSVDKDQAGEFVDDGAEIAWLGLWRSLEDAERETVLRMIRSLVRRPRGD